MALADSVQDMGLRVCIKSEGKQKRNETLEIGDAFS